MVRCRWPGDGEAKKMIDLSLLEIAILLAAGVIMAIALPPYLPHWAVYAASIGVAFYSLVQIVFDGKPILLHAANLIVFSALAARVWWRDLRGKQWQNR
jgi:hypothetical protein